MHTRRLFRGLVMMAMAIAAANPKLRAEQAAATVPRVAEPPVVQMLVPGFSVREIPVELTNVNNMLYREDGTLVVSCYDGNIRLLSDSDGDGIEDTQRVFWQNDGRLSAPIGMALTPPNYEFGRGVVVAAKGQCLLIVDTDGDDTADKEIVVAKGWNELPHGVDALGVAFDPKDHAIYFGLGTTNFTDPYLAKDQAQAGYRLDNERGTIMRVAPDLKSREIFATGIRFPVAIRFNPAGDLFCTDQEGATWLSNGNPFDELLHVERGRHYGFPPRHPKHLPNVIDEPSVFDYRPQHQSTCGLNFNEPASDGTIFGTDVWRSDAIVTGYSRGKLYRTKLARTGAGYVAQNQLIASLSMMPTDACIGPRGSLVIAAHSGGPDWGSGPSGSGKLFKVCSDENGAPVPVLAWASGPQEVRIAFDRALDSETLKGLASRVAIEGGEFVAAGDRFEVIRPGYAAVEYQQSAPRVAVAVEGAQLTPDGRTLILTTAPHNAASNYAVAFSGVRPVPRSELAQEIRQAPDLDVQYDLSGVAAKWQGAEGEAYEQWLPHADLNVSRTFTRGSAFHDEFWERLRGQGTLSLRTTLDLQAMLRPSVQIGSTIDYEWPSEEVTLTLSSNCEFEITLDGNVAKAEPSKEGAWTVRHTLAGANETGRPLEVRLQHQQSADPPTLEINYSTQEDSRPRAFQSHRFLLPWAKLKNDAPAIIDNSRLAELEGGNWQRGRQEFFGDAAGCSKCHSIRGEGSAIAPDLSNLTKRDYASVVRDISQPSFAINPDHVTQVVTTIDGRVLTGTVRSDGDKLKVANGQGEQVELAKEDIENIEAARISIMPEGIPAVLGAARFVDLLTFLLVEPPRMPVYAEQPPPPAPRSMEEVKAVLEGAEKIEKREKVHVGLIAGPKDHGLGEHDYPAWQVAWRHLFETDKSVRVTTANPWPSADDLKSADVLVFYQRGEWTPERARDIDAFLRRGGGLVYIHYAVDGGTDPTGFAERIGLAWQGGRSKFRHGPVDLEFVPGSKHPIARNLSRVHLEDESYWDLAGKREGIKLLATAPEDGEPQPLFWTVEPKIGGRVFVSIPGHYSWTFDDPIFRVLLLRGIAWSAGQPVDRFNELVLPGSRVREAKQ